MVGLTPMQKEELNKAVFEYLQKNEYSLAAQAFQEESGVDETSTQTTKDILEKKWTSIVRLKK